MGEKSFAEMKRTQPIVTDPRIGRYVMCVVENILGTIPESDQQWEVVVFDNPQPNAFALPGNKIGISSGMLRVAINQAQLA